MENRRSKLVTAATEKKRFTLGPRKKSSMRKKRQSAQVVEEELRKADRW